MRLAALLTAVLATAAAGAPLAPERAHELRTGFRAGSVRAMDLDGDGAEEILVIGKEGRVRVWGRDAEGNPSPRGEGLTLDDPTRSLLALGDLLGAGRPQLVALTPKGLLAYPVGENGDLAAEGIRVVRRARWRHRVGEPRFIDLLTDVNLDGRIDVIVPTVDTYEIWLNEGPGEGDGARPARLRRAATVNTLVSRSRKVSGRRLSDRYESGFSIPALRLQDLNGDGRRDLVVVEKHDRAYHLQREDGTIPAEPDVSLDLELFRDTTARAGVRPGKTLAGADDAKLQVDDLDRDGIPDYLIYHRRKLWIFHGTKAGPQFTQPTAILRVAEDITVLLVLQLDGDGRPDLLLVRVHVPSVAAILNGLYSELDIDISASGYAGKDGRTFARTPTWRGTVVLRLPEIMGVIRNPEALLGRLEATASKFRATATADLDGDGRDDLAMVTEDGKALELWKGAARGGQVADATGLRSMFFEEKNRVWSVDRVLDWLGDAAQRRSRGLTGGRKPDRRVSLRDPARFVRTDLRVADTDGDGRHEIVVLYRDGKKGGEGVVDVLSFR